MTPISYYSQIVEMRLALADLSRETLPPLLLEAQVQTCLMAGLTYEDVREYSHRRNRSTEQQAEANARADRDYRILAGLAENSPEGRPISESE